mmetsp:Transcript_120211/g.218479  ORF Transcript_120211/g.218479 Transcript_120211/m.218479 type:complete len:84 (+) Transcript_120211:155-406(+)
MSPILGVMLWRLSHTVISDRSSECDDSDDLSNSDDPKTFDLLLNVLETSDTKREVKSHRVPFRPVLRVRFSLAGRPGSRYTSK